MSSKFKPRILAIDDDPGIGALLIRLLGASGRYLVSFENDPRKAVEAARHFRPDLILLDVNMPGQSGVEIADRLRDEPWLRYRPIILFSGMPMFQISLRLLLGDGPMEFLQKGVPLDAIIQTVDRLVMAETAGVI